MQLSSASVRQVAVLRVFDANNGVLTEEEMRTLDQRPCRGLGKRKFIKRIGKDAFILDDAGKELLRAYDSFDVYRQVRSMPLSSFFDNYTRVAPSRLAVMRRRKVA